MPAPIATAILADLKPGDTAKIGEKAFALSADRAGVVMQQVGVMRKEFQIGGLLAKRAALEAELAAVNELIAKHEELSK